LVHAWTTRTPNRNGFHERPVRTVANRFQLTTDGHRVYADAVEEHFGCDIGYAMLVKIYGESTGVTETEARYRTTSVKDVMRWACPGMLCCIRPGTPFNGSRRSRSRCV